MNVKQNTAYTCYTQAKQRCTNPNAISYKNYGARGILFLYKSFAEFLEDVGTRPSMQHTLDRLTPDSNYSVGNVRWATWDEQVCTRRKPKTTFGITGVHKKSGRESYIAHSNVAPIYIGPDFFEACCKRKSWELGN